MAGLREGSQNLDFSGKGFLDGHILLWTLQHILWTVCKSWISVTLFLDMNPMILSPFFLLRSTHTKGPDTSGPSILPITNLIWNTSECQSLSFLLAWLWSVDEIRAELTPTINAFIVPAKTNKLDIGCITRILKSVLMQISHSFYSAISKSLVSNPPWFLTQGRLNLNQLNLGGKIVDAATTDGDRRRRNTVH